MGARAWSYPSETDEDDQGLVQTPLERNLRDRVRVLVGPEWAPSTGSPGYMAGLLLSSICVLDKEELDNSITIDEQSKRHTQTLS